MSPGRKQTEGQEPAAARNARRMPRLLALKLVLTPAAILAVPAVVRPTAAAIAWALAASALLMTVDLLVHHRRSASEGTKTRFDGGSGHTVGSSGPDGLNPLDGLDGFDGLDGLDDLTEALMNQISDAGTLETQEVRSGLYRLRNFNNQLIRLGEITQELNAALPYRETKTRVLQLTRKLLSADIVTLVAAEATDLTLEGVEGCEGGELALDCCSYYSKCPVRSSLRNGNLIATGDHSCALFPSTMRSQLSLPFALEDGTSLSLLAAAAPTEAFADVSSVVMKSLIAHVRASMSAAQRYDRIRREVATDPLTNLYNRRFFESQAKEEVARSLRYQDPVSLLMLDIDHFKSINDEYGHQTGDKVLQTIARYLKDSVRSSDIVGRYGGEEFVLVLPRTPGRNATFLADRLRKGAGQIMFTGLGLREDVTVTVSGGLATCPRDATTLEDLVGQADAALYQAKRAGRNRIVRAGIVSATAPTPEHISPQQQ